MRRLMPTRHLAKPGWMSSQKSSQKWRDKPRPPHAPPRARVRLARGFQLSFFVRGHADCLVFPSSLPILEGTKRATRPEHWLEQERGGARARCRGVKDLNIPNLRAHAVPTLRASDPSPSSSSITAPQKADPSNRRFESSFELVPIS
jgi:hypothetical protein